MGEAESFAYIARTTEKHIKNHPVGTVAAVIVDKPEWKKQTANTVNEWIADECTVERVPVGWVKKHFLTTEPYHPAPLIVAAESKAR